MLRPNAELRRRSVRSRRRADQMIEVAHLAGRGGQFRRCAHVHLASNRRRSTGAFFACPPCTHVTSARRRTGGIAFDRQPSLSLPCLARQCTGRTKFKEHARHVSLLHEHTLTLSHHTKARTSTYTTTVLGMGFVSGVARPLSAYILVWLGIGLAQLVCCVAINLRLASRRRGCVTLHALFMIPLHCPAASCTAAHLMQAARRQVFARPAVSTCCFPGRAALIMARTFSPR